MAVFFHSIASLVMAECACASMIFTSFIDVPFLVCVDRRYLNWLTRILFLSELISMPLPAAVSPVLQ